MSVKIDCECPDEDCQKDIFRQGKKQGALEELKQLVVLMKSNQKGKSGFWSVEVWIKQIEKRIKELEGGVEK